MRCHDSSLFAFGTSRIVFEKISFDTCNVRCTLDLHIQCKTRAIGLQLAGAIKDNAQFGRGEDATMSQREGTLHKIIHFAVTSKGGFITARALRSRIASGDRGLAVSSPVRNEETAGKNPHLNPHDLLHE